MKGLLPNREYEILSVKNNCCDLVLALSDIPLAILNISYEAGDKVKIIKNIPLKIGSYFAKQESEKEVGNITLISDILFNTNKKIYRLKDQKFVRYAEELEIVKTKYQLELENLAKEKEIKLQNTNKGELSKMDNNTKTYEYLKGDILKVINGIYKNIEGRFMDYVEGFDSVLIQTDDKNRLYINSSDVMLIKNKVNNTHNTETKIINIDLRHEMNNMVLYKGDIKVKFSRNKTIVILKDGSKGSTSCCSSDPFDEEKGVKIALFRALLNQTDNKEMEFYDKISLKREAIVDHFWQLQELIN